MNQTRVGSPETTKTCTKCGESKPVEDFYKDSSKSDGLRCWCRSCVKISVARYRDENLDKSREQRAKWRSENPEKAKAQAEKWRAENREKTKAASSKWRSANKEKVRASRAEYYAKNKDKALASSAAYRAANRDAVIARASRWNKENKESRRIHHQNRRARKRANGGNLSKCISEKLFNLQRGKCACCGKPLGDDYQLDHIMPLALGGEHADSNMQLLRSECNRQKHAKHPIEFMQRRGFLL